MRKLLIIMMVFALVGFFDSLCLAVNPFDENSKVTAISQNEKSKFDEKLEKLEKDIVRGLNKAGKALDILARDLDRILKDIDAATSKSDNLSNITSVSDRSERVLVSSSSSSSSSPSNNSAKAPSSSGYRKGEVTASAENFFNSLVKLVKAFGGWAEAFWKQITGPDEDEAPITNALNKLNTSYRRWKLSQAWDNFLYAFGQLFKSIGRFFKNLMA